MNKWQCKAMWLNGKCGGLRIHWLWVWVHANAACKQCKSDEQILFKIYMFGFTQPYMYMLKQLLVWHQLLLNKSNLKNDSFYWMTVIYKWYRLVLNKSFLWLTVIKRRYLFTCDYSVGVLCWQYSWYSIACWSGGCSTYYNSHTWTSRWLFQAFHGPWY